MGAGLQGVKAGAVGCMGCQGGKRHNLRLPSGPADRAPPPACPAPLRVPAALGGGSNEVASSCNTLLLGCISPLALHLSNTKATLE